jgi:cation:H+ antiporter
MLGAALLLLALLFATKSIGRLWGALMLAAYAAYMVFLFSNGAGA